MNNFTKETEKGKYRRHRRTDDMYRTTINIIICMFDKQSQRKNKNKL